MRHDRHPPTVNQSATASGACAWTSARDRPAQRPKSQSRSNGSTLASSVRLSAVCAARRAGLRKTMSHDGRRLERPERLSRPRISSGSSAGKAIELTEEVEAEHSRCRRVVMAVCCEGAQDVERCCANWRSATTPNNRPSVAHMISCPPREAIRNCQSTVAGKSSGTSFTFGSANATQAMTTI
jgi:hypothetical protein